MRTLTVNFEASTWIDRFIGYNVNIEQSSENIKSQGQHK